MKYDSILIRSDSPGSFLKPRFSKEISSWLSITKISFYSFTSKSETSKWEGTLLWDGFSYGNKTVRSVLYKPSGLNFCGRPLCSPNLLSEPQNLNQTCIIDYNYTCECGFVPHEMSWSSTVVGRVLWSWVCADGQGNFKLWNVLTECSYRMCSLILSICR
jgi:hypothetical protein